MLKSTATSEFNSSHLPPPPPCQDQFSVLYNLIESNVSDFKGPSCPLKAQEGSTLEDLLFAVLIAY